MRNKIIVAILISLLVFAAAYASYHYGATEKAEFFLYDAQAKLFRADKAPPRNIKLILIDDASIKTLEPVAGRWPWPRAIWSDLLDFLAAGGAKAVLFDILFMEQYDRMNDAALAEATAAAGNVYHSMIIMREDPTKDRSTAVQLNKPMPRDFIERFALRNVTGSLQPAPGTENNDFTLPMAPLRSGTKGVTVVEFSKDSDGIYRRTKPVREYQGSSFPVLGIAPFIDEHSTIAIGERSIRINDRVLPLDENGDFIINLYGLDKVEPISIGGLFASYQKMRMGDIENLVVNPEEFRDSIVFIGASAIGAADLKPTPLSVNTPGVILHVSLAGNYLQNDFLSPPDRRLTVLSIFLGAVITAVVVLLSKRFLVRAVFPALFLALYIAFMFYSFSANTIIEGIPFILSTVGSSFVSFGYLTFTEGAERRKVSQLFSQYVSKDVLHEVLNNYSEYMKTGAGQKAEVTILFSDIRGFTTMSETTPPEKIVEMLNVHFSHMADIILKHDGTLDKYIGDAIMAFWGAPVVTTDHAEKAVLASIEMADAVKLVNEELRKRGFEHEVKIGIGLNTGAVTIGNIGSEKKLNYTVVGDAVNLASRLESLTKEYKTVILLSEYTYEKVKDRIDCTIHGSVKVKGREQPVTIYSPS